MLLLCNGSWRQVPQQICVASKVALQRFWMPHHLAILGSCTCSCRLELGRICATVTALQLSCLPLAEVILKCCRCCWRRVLAALQDSRNDCKNASLVDAACCEPTVRKIYTMMLANR